MNKNRRAIYTGNTLLGEQVLTCPDSITTMWTFLFFVKGGTLAAADKFTGKVYSLKIKDKINLIPVKDSNWVLGMYDTINKTFYTNKGTGTFTAWPSLYPSIDNPVKILTNNWTLKVRQSIADFSSGLIRRSTNTQISLSSSKCDIEYTFSTSAWYIGKVFPVTVGNKYTINYASISSSTGLNTNIFYVELNNVITKIDDNYGTSVNCPYTFTATKPYVWIWLGYPNVVSGNVTISVSGLTLIEWEIPANTIYTDWTTETITDELWNNATAEMLLKLGNRADEQEILTGNVIRKVWVVALDGSEEWGYESKYTRFYTPISNLKNVWVRLTPMICTHFISINDGRDYANVPNGAIFTGDISTNYIFIKITEYTTLADFKAFLKAQYDAGTPVIIIYPLNSETTESVSGQTLSTVDGENTIRVSQSSMEWLELKMEYMLPWDSKINFANPELLLPEWWNEGDILKIVNGVPTRVSPS